MTAIQTGQTFWTTFRAIRRAVVFDGRYAGYLPDGFSWMLLKGGSVKIPLGWVPNGFNTTSETQDSACDQRLFLGPQLYPPRYT